MATYVLIHGAASDSWYWHRVLAGFTAPLVCERVRVDTAGDAGGDGAVTR